MDIKSFSPLNIQILYEQFLAKFPIQFQPFISMVVAGLIIYSIFRLIQRDFVYIIVLVVLVPTSIPVIQSIWTGLVSIIKFLLKIG